MIKILLYLVLLVTILGFGISSEADEGEQLSAKLRLATEAGGIYKFPEIEPSLKLYSGYYFVDLDGPASIFEYKYLDDSPVVGGELRLFRYPHRLYFESDINNGKDYFTDNRYAYGDSVLFRWLNTTSFHNLNNIKLTDIDPSTANPGIDIGDNGEKYGVKTAINRYELRLKTPRRHFHLFLNLFSVERKGLEQQRRLGGNAYFTSIVRETQSRDINWNTNTYMIGVNGHFGPLEVEYFHTEKRFNVKGDDVLYDHYTSSSRRVAGVYPHNQISELKGSSDVVKIHTAYTGKLVASATLSLNERENTSSSAKEDAFTGEGSIRWMPLTDLLLSLKYSHRDVDRDNPDSVSITDSSNLSNSYTYAVKQSLSSKTDRVSLTGVYRLMTKTTLRSEYSYTQIERDRAALWNLQNMTRKEKFSLSAATRIIKNLDLSARYIYSAIGSPSYNIEPDHSNSALASVSWIPAPWVSLLLSYNVSEDKRNDLHFPETQEAKKRDVRTDFILGTATFQLLDNLSFTAGYNYMRYRIKQDIVSSSTVQGQFVDSDVLLKETAQVYTASVYYVPKNDISLLTTISHTLTTGRSYPDNQDLVSPVSIASYSEHKVRETGCQISGNYDLKKGHSAGLDYTYKKIDDLLDNIHDSEEDGDAHIILLTISKKW